MSKTLPKRKQRRLDRQRKVAQQRQQKNPQRSHNQTQDSSIHKADLSTSFQLCQADLSTPFQLSVLGIAKRPEVEQRQSGFRNLLISDLSVEELRQLSPLIVPKIFSNYLAMLIDKELLCPDPSRTYPKSWPYDMRCLLSSQAAMNWVRDWLHYLFCPLSAASPNVRQSIAVAETNLIKLLAMEIRFNEHHSNR